MDKPKIITCHVFPPIPMRYFDWCAYRDGQEEGRVGWGSYELAAIEDLQELEAHPRPRGLTKGHILRFTPLPKISVSSRACC